MHIASPCYDLVWVRARGTPPGVVNSHTDGPDGYLLVPFGLQTHKLVRLHLLHPQGHLKCKYDNPPSGPRTPYGPPRILCG